VGAFVIPYRIKSQQFVYFDREIARTVYVIIKGCDTGFFFLPILARRKLLLKHSKSECGTSWRRAEA
jgi:hypothetical protein